MKKLYRDDWLVLLGLLLLIIGIIWYVQTHHSYMHRPQYNPPTPKATVVPATGYSSPNKTHRDIDYLYQVGMIAYQIQPTNSTVNNGDLNEADYNVIYYNADPNSTITVSGSNFNIGCIAANNQSFQQDSSIFATGGFGRPIPTATSLGKKVVVAPLQSVVVPIQTSGSCQFLGTEDGQYWWDVTKVGE